MDQFIRSIFIEDEDITSVSRGVSVLVSLAYRNIPSQQCQELSILFS